MRVSKSTIIRTIMILIVLINLLLEKIGIDIIKTDENNIALVVEYLIEIAVILTGWWYNNSFSKNALKAQEYLIKLKEESSNTESAE